MSRSVLRDESKIERSKSLSKSKSKSKSKVSMYSYEISFQTDFGRYYTNQLLNIQVPLFLGKRMGWSLDHENSLGRGPRECFEISIPPNLFPQVMKAIIPRGGRSGGSRFQNILFPRGIIAKTAESYGNGTVY
jgi:hypothetical protein